MKDKMHETIEYYNKNAEAFCNGTFNADMSYCIDKFLSYVDPNGLILDAGCGSGRDIKTFLKKGYRVEAFDASEAICLKASELSGIAVRCMVFQDFKEIDRYDGIWACASLLHVERKKLPEILMTLQKGLKANGVIYASFKYGDADRMKDGRFFVDMNEELMAHLFESIGMKMIECFATEDVREDRNGEKWINAIAIKG